VAEQYNFELYDLITPDAEAPSGWVSGLVLDLDEDLHVEGWNVMTHDGKPVVMVVTRKEIPKGGAVGFGGQ